MGRDTVVNQPRMRVSDQTVGVLASHLSVYVTGRLLSYLDHQGETLSRPAVSYRYASGRPHGARNRRKSAPYVSVRTKPWGVWHHICRYTSRDAC